jgi:hypothetical protein
MFICLPVRLLVVTSVVSTKNRPILSPGDLQMREDKRKAETRGFYTAVLRVTNVSKM